MGRGAVLFAHRQANGKRRSEIVIQFKSTPHNLFGDGLQPTQSSGLRLQPDEGMQLYMQVKEPGPGHMSLKSIPLDLSYARSFSAVKYPDAYERLLMDVVRGNLSLFMGQEEVRAAWAWTDDLLSAWDRAEQKLNIMRPAQMGPSSLAACSIAMGAPGGSPRR